MKKKGNGVMIIFCLVFTFAGRRRVSVVIYGARGWTGPAAAATRPAMRSARFVVSVFVRRTCVTRLFLFRSRRSVNYVWCFVHKIRAVVCSVCVHISLHVSCASARITNPPSIPRDGLTVK